MKAELSLDGKKRSVSSNLVNLHINCSLNIKYKWMVSYFPPNYWKWLYFFDWTAAESMSNEGAGSTRGEMALRLFGRETSAFTGWKANRDVTLVPSQLNPLTLWKVLISWGYISTAVEDFCVTTHTKTNPNDKTEATLTSGQGGIFCTSRLRLSRVLTAGDWPHPLT